MPTMVPRGGEKGREVSGLAALCPKRELPELSALGGLNIQNPCYFPTWLDVTHLQRAMARPYNE
jgi:hypothetical protein